jgi:hypothetical protein
MKELAKRVEELEAQLAAALAGDRAFHHWHSFERGDINRVGPSRST